MSDRRALESLFAGIKLEQKKERGNKDSGQSKGSKRGGKEGKAKKDAGQKQSKAAKGKQPQGKGSKENLLSNRYCALPIGRVETPGKEDEGTKEAGHTQGPSANDQIPGTEASVLYGPAFPGHAEAASPLEPKEDCVLEQASPVMAGSLNAFMARTTPIHHIPLQSSSPLTPMQTPSPPTCSSDDRRPSARQIHQTPGLEVPEQVDSMLESLSPKTPVTGQGSRSLAREEALIKPSRFARATDSQATAGSPGSAMAISPAELPMGDDQVAASLAGVPTAQPTPAQPGCPQPKQHRPAVISQATREFLERLESEPQTGLWSNGSPMAISPAELPCMSGRRFSEGKLSRMATEPSPPQPRPVPHHRTAPGSNGSAPSGPCLSKEDSLGSTRAAVGAGKGGSTGAQAAASPATQSPLEAYKAAVAAARARSRAAAAAAAAQAPALAAPPQPTRVVQNFYAQPQVPRMPVACGVKRAADARRVYRTFSRQQEALEFADACNRAAGVGGLEKSSPVADESGDIRGYPPATYEEIVRVWSEEQAGHRGYYRTFVAASYTAFWERYIRLHPNKRHFYEVIPQQHPCNLYFDLEFIPECNPDVSGESLVDCLLQLVAEGLRQYWGLELRKEHIVEMDSSTPAKFSRHIVLRIPGHAFDSNVMAGSFVTRLLSMPQAAQLTVRKTLPTEASETFTSFVDTAVYTKNRNFRLLGSCKGGKTAVLKSTSRFGAAPDPKAAFLASLVCNVPSGCQLLAVDPVSRQAKGVVRSAAEGAQRLATVQVGPNAVMVMRKADEADSEMPPEQQYSFDEVQRWAEAARPFVEAAATHRAGGQPATVRTMAHCGSTATVAFSMLGPGSHFCENIGRFHQNNHIFFVLNFAQGVFCQKCHDPDCSSFRSAWMPMPSELCPQAENKWEQLHALSGT